MRVLVAGIGNIFLGDDAFGVKVVRQIDPASLPEGVKVVDFGIRGVHLSFELLDGYDALVLVDAMPLGEPPGTVAIFEPDVESIDPTSVDAHSMSLLSCSDCSPGWAARYRTSWSSVASR